jgi:hypothetical protein
MELKMVNPNVVACNLININLFFLKFVKIEFKNKDHVVIFLKDSMIAQKKNSSYWSPHKSTLNESKLPLKKLIYSTRKKIEIFWKFFGVFVVAWTTKKKLRAT